MKFVWEGQCRLEMRRNGTGTLRRNKLNLNTISPNLSVASLDVVRTWASRAEYPSRDPTFV